MINEDRIIKLIRQYGHKEDWPELVQTFFMHLDKIKAGFPGIGNNDLSYIQFKDIKEEDYFIVDDFRTPVMYYKINDSLYRIEGIGEGPYEEEGAAEIRWKNTVSIDLPDYAYVYRVDCRPTENGGPGYYYFFKSYRDFRK